MFQGGCYQPVLTEKLKQDGEEMKCVMTQLEFKPQALTLYRPEIILVSELAAPAHELLCNTFLAVPAGAGPSFDESLLLLLLPPYWVKLCLTKIMGA